MAHNKNSKCKRIEITMTEIEGDLIDLLADKNKRSEMNKTNICYQLMKSGLINLLMSRNVNPDLSNFHVIMGFVINQNNSAYSQRLLENTFNQNKIKKVERRSEKDV